MAQLSTAREIKEQISLLDLLDRLGYQPVPKRGREKMFISMLRDDDTSPSFSVNEDLGLWFDHGIHKGGNIIDFGLAFWKGSDVSEVISRIQGIFNQGFVAKTVKPVKQKNKVSHYHVDHTREIGTHPAISAYLKERGVYEVAKAHLKEVYYHIIDEQNQKKRYFAAGWKNDKGGWEVRNVYFKGSIGPKGAITIEGDKKNCCVFEGYFDYLSWKIEHPAVSPTIIILNTIALIETGITLAKSFSGIDLFFDRDKAGMGATRDFLKALPYATDRSKTYEGFNDYNDKIRSLAIGFTSKASIPDEAHQVAKTSFRR